ncbi:MAG: RluA family pseudouridine synthase [Candidatus Omnitrophica bacterium]|nr:RluA family pseudouridine synthase [Candidatus Omnitrophota bacterium]
MQEYKIEITSEQSGKRLDVCLMGYFNRVNSGLSRTTLQKIIQEGGVRCAGVTLDKPHHKVKAEDIIAVSVEDKKSADLKAENIPLEVVYEDADLAVVNKPVGLVVHPAPGNAEHTLVNALLHRFKKLSDINPGRPGIVHRLDKETSGLLVIAKNNASHLNLARQFAKHSIDRVYVAIVKGRMEFDENVIEAPIARHQFKRKNMAVSYADNSKYAKTYYRVLKRVKDFSLLELKPFTGRTHQLRVHLKFIGHPILGDTKYGTKDDFGRLALHALSIGFNHPGSDKPVNFVSKAPKEFESFLKKNT